MAVESERLFSKLLLPGLMTLALLTSVVVFGILGPVAGIKSGYVFLGLLMAFAVYQGHSDPHPTNDVLPDQLWDRAYLGRFVFIGVFLSIIAVAVARTVPFADPTIARTGVLIVGLPVGYALLTVQIRQATDNRWLLAQIIALFALDPLTKYLATNFYFGRGDIPKHVHFTELVATTGTWQSIPEVNLYHFFPGFQTLLGSVSLLSGLPVYDSLVIVGIITYLTVVAAVYALARLVFDGWLLPVCAALGVTMLGPIHRYSVYFFPQSLAVALALIVILGAIHSDGVNMDSYGRHLLLTLPLIVSLWFTHHLTTVLFVPLLIGLVAGPAIADRLGYDGVVRPQILPLYAWVGGSVVYWGVSDVFIETLITDVLMILSKAQPSGTDAGAPVVSLGVRIPEPSVRDAALSLFSMDAMYNIMLVCVFSLGVLVILWAPRRYRRAGAFVSVGTVAAAAMIRTPIDVHGLARMQLPASVFVAFLVAAGLCRILPLSGSSLWKAAPGLLVVVLLATSASAYPADDLYGLHSGPDLWESRTLPETQKEFSAQEMGGLRQSAAFADRHDVAVGTDWHSSVGLERYRYGLPAESFAVEDRRITTKQDLVLYRQRWSERSVRLVPERTSFVTLLISEEWLDGMVRSENKVYTTGDVGMVEDHPEAEYITAGSD